ncbi:NAD(P)-binding protein [Metschnikowia bicuspidata var. bicuspidata NRRL YB-4993]|uniref:NAD(P)-binding protein n=1 Tax=Metschnikowia bicuspidata var. bicuspidata NRRL YB-4993 TaxID=869754 RepID=A0A1A0HAQ4_9ASCO|nr:NAD(P)-binding protein [Metschnikowia bicuspidata var. bicuspidata NRRL YB-4993]OBA21075.1 NAD(P)-binding protein [Metschnikowia bicuspidata var. bicuspidata NRRL YB-4993]
MTASDNQYTTIIKPQQDEAPVPFPAPTLTGTAFERFSMAGKVTVITGAAGSIGGALADAFASAGSHVAIMDFRYNPTIDKTLSEKYGVKVQSYTVDVTNAGQVQKTVQDIEADFGTIDTFIANAGVVWTTGSILNEASTYEEWARVFNVNVHGVFNCAKSVGEVFKRKGKGSLIMTASISGHIVNVPNYQTGYNASKAAVVHMGKSLAVEFAGFARVNTVSPGYTDSGLSDFVPTEQRAKWWGLTPLGREAQPEELVGAYMYLASDLASFTTGTDIQVDGGYCAV